MLLGVDISTNTKMTHHKKIGPHVPNLLAINTQHKFFILFYLGVGRTFNEHGHFHFANK